MAFVRQAIEQDAAAIARVHVESWRTTYTGIVPESYLSDLNETQSAQAWLQWFASEALIFVAEQDGDIVGFASGGAIREPVQDFEAELYAIYLLEHAQRCGIGTRLLHMLVDTLKKKGFTSMAVWALQANSSGLFYEKLGACQVASKEISIAGETFPALGFGWPNLRSIPSPGETAVGLSRTLDKQAAG